MSITKKELLQKGFSEFEKVQGDETFIMKQEKCFLVYNLKQETFYIQYIGKSGLSRLNIEKELPIIDSAIKMFKDFVENNNKKVKTIVENSIKVLEEVQSSLDECQGSIPFIVYLQNKNTIKTLKRIIDDQKW